MLLLLSLFLYRNYNFLRLSAFLLSSNFTISAKKSLSFKYDIHPLILGVEYFAKPTLTLKSILFKGSSSPLFYGKSINLNLYEDSFIDFYNETLHISDKSYLYSKLYFENCTISMNRCTFLNDNPKEYGGSIEIVNSSLICSFSNFEYCSSYYGVIYSSFSELILEDTNFSFCMAENSGSVALDRSKGQFSNCIFNNNIATNFSTISVFRESLHLTKCYFINNYVTYFACIYMNKASGMLRSCEFYKNRCDSFDTQTAVICLSDPYEVSIIGCKFAENLKDFDFESDPSIFTFGNSGIVKIRFCTFDTSVKDTILSQRSDNLTILITNCNQDLNMNLYSKSIEETMVQFSKSFGFNFSENLSLFFCIFAIFGTIFMFLAVIGIFYCVDIHLF